MVQKLKAQEFIGLPLLLCSALFLAVAYRACYLDAGRSISRTNFGKSLSRLAEAIHIGQETPMFQLSFELEELCVFHKSLFLESSLPGCVFPSY
jgi:hypothetical protein